MNQDGFKKHMIGLVNGVWEAVKCLRFPKPTLLPPGTLNYPLYQTRERCPICGKRAIVVYKNRKTGVVRIYCKDMQHWQNKPELKGSTLQAYMEQFDNL